MVLLSFDSSLIEWRSVKHQGVLCALYEKWDIAAVSSCSEMCPLIVMNEFFFGPHELELACWEITSHKNSLFTIPLEEVIVCRLSTPFHQKTVYTLWEQFPILNYVLNFHAVNAQ